MRIYKDQKSKYWYLDARQEGKGRFSLKTRNKKTAEAILQQEKVKFLEGKFDVVLDKKNDAEGISLQESMQRYLDYASLRIKPKTLKCYKQSMTNLLRYFSPSLPAKDLTPINVEGFKKYRMDTGCKPSTINRDLQFLGASLSKMEIWDLIPVNPMRKVEKLKEDNLRTRILSREESASLLKYLNSEDYEYDYLRIAIIISLNTGMRKTEILSLRMPQGSIDKYARKADKNKWNWIDMKSRLFILNETKHGKRMVPINDVVHRELKKFIKDKKDKIFPVSDFRRSFRTALRKSEIEDFTFHDFRRTFISYAAMAGYSKETIQAIAGQVSEEVFKRYAHFSDNAKMGVVQEIGRILAEKEMTVKHKSYSNAIYRNTIT